MIVFLTQRYYLLPQFVMMIQFIKKPNDYYSIEQLNCS